MTARSLSNLTSALLPLHLSPLPFDFEGRRPLHYLAHECHAVPPLPHSFLALLSRWWGGHGTHRVGLCHGWAAGQRGTQHGWCDGVPLAKQLIHGRVPWPRAPTDKYYSKYHNSACNIPMVGHVWLSGHTLYFDLRLSHFLRAWSGLTMPARPMESSTCLNRQPIVSDM